jgi:hypothetical protein
LKYQLTEASLVADFSHPYMQWDSVLWKWLFDFRIPSSEIPLRPGQDPVTENTERIVDYLAEFPAILRIGVDPIRIGGNRFATLNRLHYGIAAELDQRREFTLVDSFVVGQIPQERFR